MTEVVTSPRHTLVGRTVNNKMGKTVTILVENRVKYPLYGKYVVRSEKYHAYSEANQYNEGDKVEITESHSLSHTKSWVVSRPFEAVRVI